MYNGMMMYQDEWKQVVNVRYHIIESTSAKDPNNPNSKPDIMISYNEKGTCMLIDVAISGDRYVIKEVGDKILKCIAIIIEI